MVRASQAKSTEPVKPPRNEEDLNSDDEAINDDDDGALFRLPPIEVQQTWYPSLRKTLEVLGELHNFIDVSLRFMSDKLGGASLL